MATPVLGLPELTASQNQKYLTINDALNRIDGLINLTVFNRTQTAPTGGESAGARYIVGSPATGAFVGQENNVAVLIGTAWRFFTPSEGWRAYDQGANQELLFDGSAWNSNDALIASGSVKLTSNSTSGGLTIVSAQEDVVLSGASTSSTIAVPNNSVLLGFSLRTQVTITGPTGITWDCGSVSIGTNENFWFGNGSQVQKPTINNNFGSNTIDFTAVGGSFTAGEVRLVANYIQFDAPTS